MGRGRGACGGNAAGAGRMNDAAVGDMGAVAQLEPESARKPPADVPASGSNGAPYDDAAIQFCEAPQQTDQPPPLLRCKACHNEALPRSAFCRDHQEKVVHVGKTPTFRGRDVLLILVIGVLLWSSPTVTTPVWQTVAHPNEPGMWATISTVIARLTQRERVSPAVAGRETADGAPAGAALAKPAVLVPAVAPRVDNAAGRAVCGNGVVESGEQCDGATLGGASCARLGFTGDCGSEAACIHAGLTCLGNCRFDYSGCTAESQAAVQRFVDNGNGTATDRLTGLVWELKCTATDCQENHDVVVKLPWQAAVTTWASALNNAQFAGHNDWRLPSLEELRTLLAAVPPCATPPCPVAAWPRDETAPAGYWSSTSLSLDRQRAWAISFGDGEAYTAAKDTTLYVRAVRGGS